MDRSFKTFGQTGIFMATPEIRVLALDMGQHRPEERLSHLGIAHPVGVLQAIPARWGGTTNRGQNARVISEGICHVIKRKAVSQMNMQHRHNVGPG